MFDKERMNNEDTQLLHSILAHLASLGCIQDYQNLMPISPLLICDETALLLLARQR